MRSKHKFLIALVLVLVGALATADLLLVLVRVPTATTSGKATIGGPFSLVATNGEVVTDQTYRGQWLVIFFGYTFCPDACPTALNNISVALGRLGSDAEKLRPLFITVDPQRDTRDVMTDYLKSFDSRIIGLTGTQAQIEKVTKDYRVYVAQQKAEPNTDGYLVFHGAYIYLMGPSGKFVNVIQGSGSGEEIATWLRKQMS